MTRKEYNGWYNYETWLCNLWFDAAFSEDAERCVEDNGGNMDAATEALAAGIEEVVTDHIMEGVESSGFKADLLGAALREINFDEIARHYIEEVEFEAAADEDAETEDTDA